MLKGIDIREVNSKNAGTSNVFITLGFKYAVIVGLFDIFKGALPVVILRFMYPDNDIIWVVGGVSAIIGHVYPIFQKFRGGKGTATFGGLIFGLTPLYGLILMILFFIIMVKSDFVTIPTILAVIIFPISMFFFDFHLISIGLVSLYSILNIYKHWPNIIRIKNKTEVGLKAVLK